MKNEITRNPWIWAALLVCLVLIGVAVHLPQLAAVLSLTDPGLDGWGLALGMSLVPVLVGQVALSLRGRSARRRIRDTFPAPHRA